MLQTSGLRNFLEVNLVTSLRASDLVGMPEKWMMVWIDVSMLIGLALPYFVKKVRVFEWTSPNVIIVILVHAQSWLI